MSYLNMEEEKIREYMEKVAGGYSDPLVGLFRMKLRGHKDYFENELKEKRLIDLGCGKIFGCGLGRIIHLYLCETLFTLCTLCWMF